MAVEIKKVMETDEKGIARQVYLETHIDAILGWSDIKNGSSSNQTSNIPLADESQNGLMSTEFVKMLNQLHESNMLTITTEKVGEVE